MMTLAVSFIICTPITLLYVILLELKELKELKIEELRWIQKAQKNKILRVRMIDYEHRM